MMAEGTGMETVDKVIRKSVLLDDLINCVDYAASKLATPPEADTIGDVLRMGMLFCLEKSFTTVNENEQSNQHVITVWPKMRARIKTKLLKGQKLLPWGIIGCG